MTNSVQRSLFWPSIVAAVLGACLIYQRKGRKIFGPDGLSKFFTDDAQPTGQEIMDMLRPALNHFEARQQYQASSCLLMIKSKEGKQLEDVDVNMEMHFADGTRQPCKRFWAVWRSGEEKVLPLGESKSSLENIYLTGTALRL